MIIVTGAGRGFCAGADLAGGGETFDYREREAAGPVPRDNGGSSCSGCSHPRSR